MPTAPTWYRAGYKDRLKRAILHAEKSASYLAEAHALAAERLGEQVAGAIGAAFASQQTHNILLHELQDTLQAAVRPQEGESE